MKRLGVAVVVMGLACPLAAAPLLPEPPQRLQDTGFGAAGALAFTPQYPLWSDAADKRRWYSLPAGTAIDQRDIDAWQFPPGTRLWKEFALGGRPVETRFIERLADGSWRFASYVWTAEGSEARLAPAAGMSIAHRDAPNGRYQVPSRTDCLACHGSAPVPVLGLSALQLTPRRIAADNETERAALGYLHANCAHCHNTSDNRVPLKLTLAQSAADPVASRAAVLRSVLAASRWRAHGSAATQVIAPGQPQHSVLALRMASRDPQVQMPPLGSAQVDAEGLALIERWIRALPPPLLEKPR
ncbi:hypothetical protein HLB44_01210 [Aquincola sp. S2]|uniref:Cytochrome c domain-containing protein n=1 Tax=Pseudaquabacterium terrae TaxID=2732868 RepID=A0ABX2EB77_9BURK|nr:hypothetical protein [Aquabacterium terrae]NRF65592.1 hypothetical protein [Aquabacterium terrae]